MTPFLITGLPRCRTAWLAKVATIDGVSVCEHEPSLTMHGFEDFHGYYAQRDVHYVGMSDSLIAPMLPAILDMFPMQTLIVTRDPNDVASSLLGHGLSIRNIPSAMQAIAAVLNNPLVHKIEFTELSDSEKVLDALQWLMPDAEISVAYIEAMQPIHIEADHNLNRTIWQENQCGHMTNPPGN